MTFRRVAILLLSTAALTGQAPSARPPLASRAQAALAQHTGTVVLRGLKENVEVRRDRWGIPHIYARNTADLFSAQGFVTAQDRMWQLEMWRRNGEGRLSEVLGPRFVTRDRFARLLAFRGDWDAEFRKYHPEGPVIFASFAAGVNAAIQKAIDEEKIPVEFEIMGFRPQPVWTAKTVLTRMPGWTLSRNAASEIQRAVDVRTLGVMKVEELKPTDPETRIVVPAGLDLADIDPAILTLTQNANDVRSSLTGDLGSNNWVVAGSKSATGSPLLANDPHREVTNPALRYLVHLVAPGWNALGATEPGLPGISVGHNERLAWGFTILGIDQQDVYVEETHPENPERYLYRGAWEDMRVERELIHVKGSAKPEEVELELTRHGPVIWKNRERNRAYALRWVGSEPGGAGYLGSLAVMQTKNWTEFGEALTKAWYLPSHSLVYADVDRNIGYVGVGLTPIRRGWDGLLPVPGRDGKYEWQGFLPFEKLPRSLNAARGFYNSSNNDVVPRIVPGYPLPLGFEYSPSYRYDRVAEVLKEPRAFTVADLSRLQHDAVSLPAREIVPRLRGARSDDPEIQAAIARLLGWDYVVDRDSVAATIYEFWMMKLAPRVYATRIPEGARSGFRAYNMRRVLEWATDPQVLKDALAEALAEIEKRLGKNVDDWKWGRVHAAAFLHPLSNDGESRTLFEVAAVPRSGDGYTVLNTGNPTESNTRQLTGASFSFVFDVKDWDQSLGLSAPGNSGQPSSPHYKDLIPYWADGKPFPLPFSRGKVEEATEARLRLEPLRDVLRVTDSPLFEPVQPDLFSTPGAQPNAWADFDGDGDIDLFVGFRGQINRLYRNDNGTFVDVAARVGLADSSETRVAAWGDYDADGDPDLYVGFAPGATVRNKLYRNDGPGKGFTDVAHDYGLDLVGTTRQASFIDFDNDGDLDFFVAFRDRPNFLFRNDGGKLVDVSKAMGIDDPRRTVGTVWFDMDQDGDLDLFVANQNGDLDGFFRNDGSRFVDVASALGMDGAPRPAVNGGVGPSLADYDNDGDLDLYVANYGPNVLYRNDGGGRFTEVASDLGVAGEYHATTSIWGDYDNDGRIDLYVGCFLTNILNDRDYLYRNEGGRFSDATPALILKNDASHGVEWADFDADGDLDLALADNHPGGKHFLFRNLLPPKEASRSIQVMVLDGAGRATRAGAEVRVYAPGTRTILGTRLMDTGSGYCSQNVMPVHVGLPAAGPVDVEVTFFAKTGRQVVRVPGVDPNTLPRRVLEVRTSPASTSSSR